MNSAALWVIIAAQTLVLGWLVTDRIQLNSRVIHLAEESAKASPIVEHWDGWRKEITDMMIVNHVRQSFGLNPEQLEPLIEALRDDFRGKCEDSIIDLARRYAGTKDESLVKEEAALWHAKRLEACGLLLPGMTPERHVELTFKVAREKSK